jgi:predicted RNA-binding protein with PUA-like domain
MPKEIRYWLVKSEPDVFGFDDLLRAPQQTTMWEGVRNYQARNFMRDAMKPGDQVLFYHSSTTTPGVVGVAEVASEARPDSTQFDPDSGYFDAKATRDAPRWFLVDIRAVRKLPRVVTLDELKREPTLSKMRLVQRGNRLSVMPVECEEFETIIKMSSQA